MAANPVDNFIQGWDHEAKNTVKLLQALPSSKYDFRPDPDGRSLGELAWHLAEIDAYVTHGFETGTFDLNTKPPNIERPRSVEALAPGYEKIHREAVARVRKLKPEDLDRTMKFFTGNDLRISDILYVALLHHSIHHRGQLTLMCRLAGGSPPGIYGPTREEMVAFRNKT